MPKDDRRGELLIGTRATADVQPDRKTEKKGTYWPIKNFIGRAFFIFKMSSFISNLLKISALRA